MISNNPDPSTLDATFVAPAAETDPAFAAVYSEIQRLSNRKANVGGTILMLVLSVGLFVALGRSGQAWKPLLMIVGVIFVHELGHMAAMRLFHYRNLRMFFIPLFGAAVSGQNYNAPGWKKAVVSLAGPLPGIALGAVLGIVAAVCHWPTLMEAAMLFVGLNGFNLLPIMPLDGGQLMHAALFSRHPMFDVAFRVIATVALMLGWLIGLRILAVLGFVMLFGLPTHYRVAQVVHRLRRSGLDASSPDAQTIPAETARRIYEELKQALPSLRQNPKGLAQVTLNAFELLNAHPPAWPATIALIGVHGLAFLSALVITVVLFAARQAAFGPPPQSTPPEQATRLSAPPPFDNSPITMVHL